MSEYLHVENPFLDRLAILGWTVIDQGHGLFPSEPAASLRESVRAINRNADGTPWLTDRQLDDLRSQILRQPTRTLNLSVATLLPISYIGRKND